MFNLSENEFYKEIVRENIKGKVIIEIGAGSYWKEIGKALKNMGAEAYVAIDTDENLLINDETEKQIYDKENDKDLYKGVYLVVDDPVNLLSKLRDHSSVIISANTFNEPMHKNKKYTEKLCNLIAEKTSFGLHAMSTPFDWKSSMGVEESEENTKYLKLDMGRIKAFIFKNE
ncbi:hypothetical protein ACFL23_02740 [Patescibacteria group bacterium]